MSDADGLAHQDHGHATRSRFLVDDQKLRKSRWNAEALGRLFARPSEKSWPIRWARFIPAKTCCAHEA